MKTALVGVGAFVAGAWVALYCRCYLGAFVTWAFGRGDTPAKGARRGAVRPQP